MHGIWRRLPFILRESTSCKTEPFRGMRTLHLIKKGKDGMITLENVGKTFVTKDRTIEAVKNVNLHIEKGEIYGVIGFSGAGKSTLVRCINLLERPTEGKVFLKDKELTAL